MKRHIFLAYGMFAYAAFIASIFYSIGFIGNLWVPRQIDGEPVPEGQPAWLNNLGWFLLFALQHSLMARPAFKRRWTRFVPVALERSTYVLMASACLMLLMWNWQPLGGTVWKISQPTARVVLHLGYGLGWIIVFLSTFLINHFDLFGLRQVWLYWQQQPYQPLHYKTPFLYQVVRHPLYLGFLIVFWTTPEMSLTHLLFAIGSTVYILLAIRLEEKDLLNEFGETYQQYRKQVPMILPIPRFQKFTFDNNHGVSTRTFHRKITLTRHSG